MIIDTLKAEINNEKQNLDDYFGDLCAASVKEDELFIKCCVCAEKLQFLLKEFEFQLSKQQTILRIQGEM